MKTIATIVFLVLTASSVVSAQNEIVNRSAISQFNNQSKTFARTSTYTNYFDKRVSFVKQDTTSIYQIITNDGNEFIGVLVEQDAQKVILNTTNFGVITIQKVNIRSMTLVEQEKIKDGLY